MKKVLLLALLATAFIIIVPHFLGKWVQRSASERELAATLDDNDRYAIGDLYFADVPARWSVGFPLAAWNYGDCPSGCIELINPLNLTIDIVFWFLLFAFLFAQLNDKGKLKFLTAKKYDTARNLPPL